MEYLDSLPRYDQEQIDAIRCYVCELKTRELKAIYMRFWGPCSIQDIAAELGVSWDTADRILDRALMKLRAACVRDPVFARRLFLPAA